MSIDRHEPTFPKPDDSDLKIIQAAMKKMQEEKSIEFTCGPKENEEKFTLVHNQSNGQYYLCGKELGRGAFGKAVMIYPIEPSDDKISINKEPEVVKILNNPDPRENDKFLSDIKKEISGLKKVYPDASFCHDGMKGFIFAPYMPGKPIISDQDISQPELKANKELAQLSVIQKMRLINEGIRQLYKVHTPELAENIPARNHGDIKGSNFHFYADQSGKVHVFLMDFGTSEEVKINEAGKPMPVMVDEFVGSAGHITASMIPDLKEEKFPKSISDDIHNMVPLIIHILGGNNPYLDKAEAVREKAIERIAEEYDLYLVKPETFKPESLPSKPKRKNVVLAKDKDNYSAYFYQPSGSFIKCELSLSDNIKEILDKHGNAAGSIVQLTEQKELPKSSKDSRSLIQRLLNIRSPREEKKEPRSPPLSSPSPSSPSSQFSSSQLFPISSRELNIQELIKQALMLRPDFSYGKIKFRNQDYRGEQMASYNFDGMFSDPSAKNWVGLKPYVQIFLNRMQSGSTNSLEMRLFWEAINSFCEENQENVNKHGLIDLPPKWENIFDFLVTDHSSQSKDINQFKEITGRFFHYMDNIPDKDTLQEHFWNGMNDFLNAHAKKDTAQIAIQLTKLSDLTDNAEKIFLAIDKQRQEESKPSNLRMLP